METDNDNFGRMLDAVNGFFTSHGVDIQLQPLTAFVIIAVIFITVFFLIPASISYRRRHKNAKKKNVNCTHATTGKIIELVKREVYHYRDDGTKDWTYEYLAKIAYLDDQTTYLVYPISHYKKNFGEGAEYKVDDALKIWYDPNNPKDAMADVDMKEGLNTNWYTGLLGEFKVLTVFAVVVVIIVLLMGCGVPTEKEDVETDPIYIELSANGYNISLSGAHIKVEYEGVIHERDLDNIYAQMAYDSMKDFDDLTDKESTLNILYLMSKNAGYDEIFESITR